MNLSKLSLNSVSVVHSLPGRLRLRISRLASDRHFVKTLEQKLTSHPAITHFRINAAAASLVIEYAPALTPEINRDFGSLWQKMLNQPNDSSIEPDKPQKLGKEEWSNLALPTAATLLAIACQRFPQPGLSILARSVLLAAAFPVAARALKSIFGERKLNIDCLDLLALIFSGFQGKLLTPSLIITLHELGDIIRDRTARATEKRTANLLDTIGHYAWVEKDGEIKQITSDAVQIGETVVVYPGESIPVDGTVWQGEAVIDQQQLTGESLPIVARKGTLVYASTLVRSGQIRLTCERVGQQTRAAASIELLQKAPVHDTRMANYAANLADRLILPSLGLASLIFLTTRDAARAAAILTLDFVTGIRVSLPTAFLGALNHTTRHGVLVRSGRTLELLADIDTIVFDKTGTLTTGEVMVVGVETISGRLSPERILQLAASAEQRITHPVAMAIADYAQRQGVEILPRGDWDYQLGLGMRAEIDGNQVLVGSDKFLRQQGVNLEELGCDLANPASAWVSRNYLACNGQFQGVIHYTDPLRADSRWLIDRLQQDYGMTVHLLTGDNQQRAKEVAQALNIPFGQVHAEAFPEQKAKIVRELHRSGHTVAFVGDGLNDSVALAYADVSISFEKGSEVARETADVVLMNNDLSSLLEAIAIAQETKALIEQNIFLVVAPNLVALVLATSIGLNPLLATAIHNGTAIIAGLNSLRPLVFHQLQGQKETP
ncbi:MAG: heavy metal translocating P-type ATPase [Microcystis viridis Mv_BB_P_19951000_S69]|uniref:Heavy metal translocating P-type ATPase n=1 Tax=Microcystis viridis Mv_BB_P_19951000_S68D TaxID=2486270 RepID=A0A552HIJ3_MICVR|nr:MAG: heavy metal translocating P-type ATPase [Microcystis viridis Mv_BB_P_19951000_S68D]TRU72544.1 MAG: heavy metal translocating P-type ATPase [Microcystis viridis Mv_BB_P_19951000_S69]TRU77357.1 MAG: heavy metal translocating P-type ATPase [Microcystis viridis Mv_BB_P_19951000_S68]TRU82856.1 MAG: heavy metal translocating P-type ATPase [Microcystis viridis Mv_BB_P_19951000_S69D]